MDPVKHVADGPQRMHSRFRATVHQRDGVQFLIGDVAVLASFIVLALDALRLAS
jgi:hypothetical protein